MLGHQGTRRREALGGSLEVVVRAQAARQWAWAKSIGDMVSTSDSSILSSSLPMMPVGRRDIVNSVGERSVARTRDSASACRYH